MGVGIVVPWLGMGTEEDWVHDGAALYASVDYADSPEPAGPFLTKGLRPKVPAVAFPENRFAARPVNRKEVERTPGAQAALKVEWDRLRKIRTWDERWVRRCRDVLREADPKNPDHIGRIFEICVEKGRSCRRATPTGSLKAGSCSRATMSVPGQQCLGA